MQKDKFIGQYFGLRKIEGVEESEEKTYLGKEKITLIFEEKERQDLPLEVVELLISSTSTDLSTLREKRVKPVVERLLIILLEAELTIPDLEYAVGPKLKFSLEDTVERANTILWNGKEAHERTLNDIEKVLKKNVGT